eukprot:g8840.t1
MNSSMRILWNRSKEWLRLRQQWSEITRTQFSTIVADGGSSQSPKHFGRKSSAFTRLDGMPIRIESVAEQTSKSSPPKRSTISRVFNLIGNTLMIGGVGIGGIVGYYTYRYEKSGIEELIKKCREGGSVLSRSWCWLMEYYLEQRIYLEGEIRSFAHPRQDCLLPDIPPGYKTLVLDLDEVLVYSEWTRLAGWKVFKRNGLQQFIQEVVPYFDVVVYSDQLSTYVDPIMDRLDPSRRIHRLYRPDTNYVNGKHVRDLSKLGRDLSQVLMISAKADAWALQPDNTIKLLPWRKESADTLLLDLVPFLQFLGTHQLKDVRDVVKAYDGKDIPSTFKERVKHMTEEQQKKSTKQRGLLGSFQK